MNTTLQYSCASVDLHYTPFGSLLLYLIFNFTAELHVSTCCDAALELFNMVKLMEVWLAVKAKCQDSGTLGILGVFS